MSNKSALAAAIDFFANLKGNAGMLSTIPSSLYDNHLNTLRAKQVKDDDLSFWEVSHPLAGSYGTTEPKVNININGAYAVPSNWRVIADTRKEMLVNRPTSTRLVAINGGVQLWVTSLHAPIARFDFNGSYVGGFGRIGSGVDNASVYEKATDVAVSVGQKLVAVVSQATHQVRLFDLDTNEPVGVIGSYCKAGCLDEGLLNEPSSAIWLPNGNLLVACRKGSVTADGIANGLVAEFDKTGTLVKAHLEHTKQNAGEAWHDGVTDPAQLNLDSNGEFLYICYQEKNYVAAFKVDGPDGWEYGATYGRQGGGFGAGILKPSASCVDTVNSRLYVTMTDPDVVVCMDLASHDILGRFGRMAWDDPGETVRLNNLYQLSGVVLHNHTLYLSMRGNNRVISVPEELLFGDQWVFIDYSQVNISNKSVVRSSKANVNVDDAGNVTYRTTKEDFFSRGFGSEKYAYIIMRERDR